MPLLRALLLVLLLVPHALAASGDPALPKPDPKGHWRVIGQDDATTTSRCIGDTSTPLCAMETYMASGVRHNDSLFNKAALLLPGEEDTTSGRTGYKKIINYDAFTKYTILSSIFITSRNINIPLKLQKIIKFREFKSSFISGDVIIFITSWNCYDHRCSDWERSNEGAVLRRIGKEWKVVLMRPGITQVERVDGKGDSKK